MSLPQQLTVKWVCRSPFFTCNIDLSGWHGTALASRYSTKQTPFFLSRYKNFPLQYTITYHKTLGQYLVFLKLRDFMVVCIGRRYGPQICLCIGTREFLKTDSPLRQKSIMTFHSPGKTHKLSVFHRASCAFIDPDTHNRSIEWANPPTSSKFLGSRYPKFSESEV
jgi:hypothetical protein